MDFSLSNEQRAWQMTARKFAQEEIKPISLDLDEAPDAHGTFDWDIVEKGSRLGFRTLAVPKEYGGEGTDFVTQALVMAELARGDGSLNTFYGVQSGLAMGTIAMLGSEEQKTKWLPPMARCEKIGAFGLTEPNHGSDVVQLETRARREGGEYVLDGAKRWIGNASFADVTVIWARDDEGNVGPIGGIPQKLYGAKAANAKVFLTPAANCEEAKANALPGLPLAKVSTLADALAALATVRAGGQPPSC